MTITSPPVLINNYLIDKLIEALPNSYSQSTKPIFLPTSPSSINAISSSNASEVFAIYDRMFRLRRSPFPHCKKEQLLYYFYKVNEDPEALFEVVQVVYDLMDRGDESAQDLNAWVQSKVQTRDLLDPNGRKVFQRTTGGTYVYYEEYGIEHSDKNPSQLNIVIERDANGDAILDSLGNEKPIPVQENYITFGSNGGATDFKPVFFYETKVFQLEESRDIEGFDSTATFFASKMIINYDYHVQDYGKYVRQQSNSYPLPEDYEYPIPQE